MIKKSIIILITALMLCGAFHNQDIYAKDPPIKALYGDINYGKAGLGVGAGFRWWLFSANLGLAGFATKIPNYSTDNNPEPGVFISAMQPLPDGFFEERYSSTQVSFDLGLHVDYYDPISVFLHFGVYTAQDSVLAARVDERGRTNRYRYRTEAVSGFAFGGGLEYIWSNTLSFAVGYHTRKGVFGRVVYTWW